MYLTSVLALLEGARAVLYDGSPFLPDLQAFVRLLAQQRYGLPVPGFLLVCSMKGAYLLTDAIQSDQPRHLAALDADV